MRHSRLVAAMLIAAMTVSLTACAYPGDIVNAVSGVRTAAKSADSSVTADEEETENAADEDISEGKTSDSRSGSSKQSSMDKLSDAKDASADDTEEKESVLDKLPKVGDVLHGFKVTDITDYELKDAKLVSMDHEQSGAELLYIACDDPDKAFNVYYRTAADSDKGIPHIFEHITLSGSGKYPNADLWELVKGGTYNTHMNASTWQHATTYNAASLSNEQLLKIADLYMDGLTDPMALRDEHPLGREAYRFSLDSADGDISVTGAVFNEMEKENSGIAAFAERSALKLLYPASQMSYNMGGYRDDIITVTLDELKSYYTKYYHPSNMLIVLYGDMDYDSFLEMLDEEYLSDYEQKDISITDSKYIPWTGSREAVISYPAPEDASGEDSSEVIYAVSLGDISLYDLTLMNVAASLISTDSSCLRQRMEEEFPDASFDAGIEPNIKQPVMMFTLTDCDAGAAEHFREVLKESIDKIREEGINKELAASFADSIQMENALEAENHGGVDLSNSFGLNWAIYGDRLSLLDTYEAYDNIKKETDAGTLDELIDKYIKAPDREILLEVDPEPGLEEQVNEAFAALLADKKASMSSTEIAELIGSTAEFNVWSELSAGEAQKYFDEINVAELEAMPEEYEEAEVVDETAENGLRILSSEIEDAPYLSSDIYLNADTLEFDEIHDMVFLGKLLGVLGTKTHTSDELELELNNVMSRFGAELYIAYDEKDDGRPHPYLKISSMSSVGNITGMYDVIEEILKETDFSDTAYIRHTAAAAASELTYSMNSSPQTLAVRTALAASDENRRYGYYASSLEYLEYLNDVAGMNDKELKSYIKGLKTVLDKLLNINGMVYAAVGSEEAIADGRKALETFAAELDDTETEAVDYSKELARLKLADSMAITINNNVNYNGIAAGGSNNPFDGNGADQVVFTALQSAQWYPAFRYDIGAYGFMDDTTPQYSYLVSYADPEIAASFEYYDSIPDKAAEIELTQQDIDSAALKVYALLAYPMSPLDDAYSEIAYAMQHKSKSYAEETVENMKLVKKVTPEDVNEAADKLSELIENGVRVTAGSSAEIKKNKELYELTINTLTR